MRNALASGLAAAILQLASGEGAASLAEAAIEVVPQISPDDSGAAQSSGDYMAPWIDTEQCTACDECTKLNPNIFEYNENKKAYIKNPDGGPYQDLVKAAERCTARVIHPGLPRDRSAKDIDKWIKRGSKFN